MDLYHFSYNQQKLLVLTLFPTLLFQCNFILTILKNYRVIRCFLEDFEYLKSALEEIQYKSEEKSIKISQSHNECQKIQIIAKNHVKSIKNYRM